ncbi:MAG: hypothetical protein A2X36_06480 [Elusimicrobia bacterium GWA2_69_24]|nr:MAG: hypothetical protein A2X36_06480 [Elusimicrobia bacterium GWA2_69_24]
MRPGISLKVRTAVYGRMQLARLLEMREEDFARLLSGLEADPLFPKLVSAGAVAPAPVPQDRFTARRFAGRELRQNAEGIGDLLDGQSEMVKLMRRIGAERFEECFIKDRGLTDAERARLCGIKETEALALRELLDRAYIRAEFEGAPPPVPAAVYSTVAGIVLEGGTPRLKYFNRDAWKTRYRFDAPRLEAFVSALPAPEREKARRLVARLEFAQQRRTTLLKVLEAVLQAQAAYLSSGDPALLQALTQREVSAAVGCDPSVLNRLISNKAVELPWGTEAPLRTFFPSAKSLTKSRVADAARRHPELSDEKLRELLSREFRIELSRRSVAQYRQDTGVGGRGRR